MVITFLRKMELFCFSLAYGLCTGSLSLFARFVGVTIA